MAALWNLSLRSNRCEEIREQMIQCDILPALAAMAELTPNAMVSSENNTRLATRVRPILCLFSSLIHGIG
jgi:hypothetical protein